MKLHDICQKGEREAFSLVAFNNLTILHKLSSAKVPSLILTLRNLFKSQLHTLQLSADENKDIAC